MKEGCGWAVLKGSIGRGGRGGVDLSMVWFGCVHHTPRFILDLTHTFSNPP